MRDFASRLLERSTPEGRALQPRIAGRFEAEGGAGPELREATVEEAVAPPPRRSPPERRPAHPRPRPASAVPHAQPAAPVDAPEPLARATPSAARLDEAEPRTAPLRGELARTQSPERVLERVFRESIREERVERLEHAAPPAPEPRPRTREAVAPPPATPLQHTVWRDLGSSQPSSGPAERAPIEVHIGRIEVDLSERRETRPERGRRGREQSRVSLADYTTRSAGEGP